MGADVSGHPAIANPRSAAGDSGRQVSPIRNDPGELQRSPTVARESFIEAMRGAATGVSVVATDGTCGRFGITVSSFASVSAEPPLLLACVERRSPAGAAIAGNGRFSVNLLSTRHQHVAAIFSGRVESDRTYHFESSDWKRLPSGVPGLCGAIATFECALASSFIAGSHTVFIGQVVGAAVASGDPLVYSNRSYGQICPLNPTRIHQENRHECYHCF